MLKNSSENDVIETRFSKRPVRRLRVADQHAVEFVLRQRRRFCRRLDADDFARARLFQSKAEFPRRAADIEYALAARVDERLNIEPLLKVVFNTLVLRAGRRSFGIAV